MKKLYAAVLVDCLKRSIIVGIIWIVLSFANLVVFQLYQLNTEPFIYSEIITFFVLIVGFAVLYIRSTKQARDRKHIIDSIQASWNNLPSPESLLEFDYQEIINKIGTEMIQNKDEFDASRQEMLDYYTTWVHQIKTPIAVIKMQLSENTEEGRIISGELFRIEQYVEAVLQYARLESDINDLVIKEYDLDEIIRGSLRKLI